MTTLVTGAGLIGTAFAQEAAKRGETVVFFDARPDAAYLQVKLGDALPEVVRGDVRDLPALVDAVRTHGIDTLVHTAGLIGGQVSAALYTGLAINVGGTINVAEAARLGGVRRFVHVSTNGVYNRRIAHQGPIAESHPRGGGGPYASSKTANEVLLETYAEQYGFELLMVRPAAVFGYGHYVAGSSAGIRVHALVEGGIANARVDVPAAQAAPQEYVYGRDVGRMIDRLATIAMPTQTVFNAATGIVSTFEEMAAAAKTALPGLDARIEPSSVPAPQPLDITAAREVLEWEPAYSLEEAFADYVEEFKRASA